MKLFDHLVTAFLLVIVPSIANAAGALPTTGAERRWNALTPAERQLARARFESWKKLDADERETVSDRGRLLQRVRAEVIERLPEETRAEFRGMPARERNRFLKNHLRSYLEVRRREVLDQAGIVEARPRTSFTKVRRAVQSRAIDALLRLEERGVLAEGEADRLSRLPAEEFSAEMPSVLRRAILQDPPNALLLLPEEERRRILALDEEAFLEAMRSLRGRDRRRLPRTMEAELRGQERPRRFSLALLEGFMTPEQVRAVRSAPAAARRREVDRALVANARRAMIERGEDPAALEPLKRVPAGERELRLLEAIDPEFDPDDPFDYRRVLLQRREMKNEEMRRARDDRRANRRDPR